MDLAQLVHPTAGGLALAAGAVVAGAPLFSAGLRALRLRRLLLANPAERPLGLDLAGFVHVTGTVTLESPLFTPLSSSPCAGFQLEVRAIGAPIVRAVEARRPFRVSANGVSARVAAASGRWLLSTTAERDVGPDDHLSENLGRLLQQAPEALWWRRVGGRLRIVERALLAGSACHVVGSARSAHPLERTAELELAATGTDGAVELTAARGAVASLPELRLEPGDFLDFLLVADRAPDSRALAAPRWRTLGVLAGPALSLFGLLYLAAAAELFRSLGRF
jgi:hypothetical protein